jgi:gliding motility-associated-like protein
MLRLPLLIIVFSIICNELSSQVWISSSVQKGDNIEPKSSHLDNQNNSIIASVFQGTIYQQGYVSYGSNDLALFKINSVGDVLWSQQIGSTGNESVGGVTVDEDNNIYLVGNYSALCRFSSSINLTNNGGFDIFLAKYNPSGILQWAKTIGTGIKNQSATCIKYDHGKLIITGYYKEILIIGSGVNNYDTLYSGSNSSIFISQFDTSGNRLWANRILSNDDANRFSLIALANDGYYFGGNFRKSIYLDIDTINSQSDTYSDAFIYKTDINGIGQWVRKIRGSNSENLRSITQNDYGDVYLVGNYNSPFILVDSVNENSTIYMGHNNDNYIFVAKYNSNGILQWLINKGSTFDNFFYDITIANNVIYTAGYFSGQIIFSNDTLLSSSTSNYEPFLAAFNENGIEMSGISMTGTGNYYDVGVTVMSDDNSRAYVAGYYRSQQIQIGSQTYTSTNVNQSDQFFAVYKHPLIALVKTQQMVSCYGLSDGMLEVEPYFGRPPYAYLWSHDPLLHQPKAQNLPAGDYTVTITDANSEQTVVTKTITQPSQMVLAALIAAVQCPGGSDGGADLTVTNGNAPLSYLWSNGQTNEDLAGVVSGSYMVTVTDSSNCSVQGSVVIPEPPAIGIDIAITEDILCYGQSTAAVTANPTGGTGSFTYLWDDAGAQTTKIATDLAAGRYSVQVTDENGCTRSDTTIISQPDSLSITAVLTDPLCAGSSDGSVIPTVSGGTPGFEYVWSNSVYQRFNTDIPAGTYTVTVSDNNNCTLVKDFVLTDPPPLVINTVDSVNATCYGYADGSVTIHAAGGTGILQYSADNGANFGDNPAIGSLPAGDYLLVAKDSNDCRSPVFPVTLSQWNAIVINTVDSVAVSCYGLADGSITINASGGTGALQYSNDNGVNFGPSPVFEPLPAGDYILLVKDDNDCRSSVHPVNLAETGPVVINTVDSTDISCYGLADGTLTINASGGTGTLHYSADNGANFDLSPEFGSLPAGDYALVVKDDHGCMTPVYAVKISQPESFAIDTVEVILIDATHPGGSVTLESSGGITPATFVIVPDSSSNASGEFTGLQAGDYRLLAYDARQCRSNVITLSIPEPGTELTIYDAFSPNGDGKNDVWNILNIGYYPKCTVKIFNSWGTTVFSSKGYGKPWDGKYNGNDLPSGTYYYMIDPGDGTSARTGPVSIVK